MLTFLKIKLVKFARIMLIKLFILIEVRPKRFDC